MSDSEPPIRFRHPVAVRFRDTDIGGHVHHAQALVYMEEARWAYWKEVAGREGVESVDYIMAEVSLRYHRRVLYPGEVVVGVRTASVGRKHFEMVYEVRDGGGALLVSGRSTQVMYDYGAGASARVPDELRRRLEAFEGGALPTRRG
jgi:acyl-CoA thioester hydrolase